MYVEIADGFWGGFAAGVGAAVALYSVIALVIGFRTAMQIAHRDEARRLADAAESRNILLAQSRREW